MKRKEAKRCVGLGWHQLIDILFNTINEDDIYSIKEKYGTLRIDAYNLNGQQQKLVELLEESSGHICEQCGRFGEERDLAWIKTLCDVCYNKKYENTKEN